MSDAEFNAAVETVRCRVLERVGRNGDAEDAVQEITFRASQKAEQFKDEEQLFAYVWKAAVQELRLGAYRQGRRRRKLKEAWSLEHQGAPEAGQEVEDRLHLEALCAELEPELRQAVLDVLFGGKLLKECALPRSTVADAVARIRAEMRYAS